MYYIPCAVQLGTSNGNEYFLNEVHLTNKNGSIAFQLELFFIGKVYSS